MTTRWKFLSIFFLLALSSSATAQSRTAYLGVVGAGAGRGSFGHVITVIQEENQSLFASKTYQYNVIVSTDPKADLDLGLHVSKTVFFELYFYYTEMEDRSVYLYQLNLSQSEIDAFEKGVEGDFESKDFAKGHRYGLNNNCAARPVAVLNEIVDPSRRISMATDEKVTIGGGTSYRTELAGLALNRFPFYLAHTLEKHPISKGRVRDLESRSIRELRIFSEIDRELSETTPACGWDENIADAVRSATFLFIRQPTAENISFLSHLPDRCPQATAGWRRILLLTYNLVPDRNVKKAIASEIRRLGPRDSR